MQEAQNQSCLIVETAVHTKFPLPGQTSDLVKKETEEREIVFETLVIASLRGIQDLPVDFRGSVPTAALTKHLSPRFELSWSALQDMGRNHNYFRFMQDRPDRDPKTCGMIAEFEDDLPNTLFEHVIFTFMSRLCWSHVVKRKGGEFHGRFDGVWDLTEDLWLPMSQLLRSTFFAYADPHRVRARFQECKVLRIQHREQVEYLTCDREAQHPDTQRFLNDLDQ